MPWDEPEEVFPVELRVIWQLATAGTHKLELRALLEQLPAFKELPRKAASNNYRNHAAGTVDKQVKMWQKSLLHILRIHAVLWCECASTISPDNMQLMAMGWQMQAELY